MDTVVIAFGATEQPEEGGLHAGEWETSMLLAIHPELVHEERGEPEHGARYWDEALNVAMAVVS